MKLMNFVTWMITVNELHHNQRRRQWYSSHNNKHTTHCKNEMHHSWPQSCADSMRLVDRTLLGLVKDWKTATTIAYLPVQISFMVRQKILFGRCLTGQVYDLVQRWQCWLLDTKPFTVSDIKLIYLMVATTNWLTFFFFLSFFSFIYCALFFCCCCCCVVSVQIWQRGQASKLTIQAGRQKNKNKICHLPFIGRLGRKKKNKARKNERRLNSIPCHRLTGEMLTQQDFFYGPSYHNNISDMYVLSTV